jgi:hypothetical protein
VSGLIWEFSNWKTVWIQASWIRNQLFSISSSFFHWKPFRLQDVFTRFEDKGGSCWLIGWAVLLEEK